LTLAFVVEPQACVIYPASSSIKTSGNRLGACPRHHRPGVGRGSHDPLRL